MPASMRAWSLRGTFRRTSSTWHQDAVVPGATTVNGVVKRLAAWGRVNRQYETPNPQGRGFAGPTSVCRSRVSYYEALVRQVSRSPTTRKWKAHFSPCPACQYSHCGACVPRIAVIDSHVDVLRHGPVACRPLRPSRCLRPDRQWGATKGGGAHACERRPLNPPQAGLVSVFSRSGRRTRPAWRPPGPRPGARHP